MTGGNGNGQHHHRRAEDHDRETAEESAWQVFCEAVKTMPTREAHRVSVQEYRNELAAQALRREGMRVLKSGRPIVSGGMR